MGDAAEKLLEEVARLSKAEPRAIRFLEYMEKALELPDDERRLLAERLRDEVTKARGVRGPVASWSSLRRARGAVQLGGDAVVDCDRLYDG